MYAVVDQKNAISQLDLYWNDNFKAAWHVKQTLI